MDLHGVYLYGFIPEGAANSLDLGEIEGVEGAGAVEFVELGGVAAVVGQVPVHVFESALNDSPDPTWLIPRALGHERVLGAILVKSAVLPARFGTIFSSNDALAGLAQAHLSAIEQYFTSVGDQREWSLRGYLETENAIVRVLEFDPDLAARVARLPCAPGARYFLEKKLREDARGVARRAGASAASAVREAIRQVVSDSRSLPLRAPDAPGRDMVLHEAALIPRGRELEVLAAAEFASTSAGNLLKLEPSGPWPPFHFCPELGETAS